jgi:hypothetical protein
MENQGRSKRQMEGNYKAASLGIIGIVLTLVYLVIFN